MLASNCFMGESVEVAAMTTARKTSGTLLWPSLAGGALFLLIFWLYHSILFRLVMQWVTDKDFSHGFFVPAFALFVVWQNRNRLQEIPISPSWLGLPVVILAMVMLLLGELGVELFTSRTSLVILLGGLILLFCGWALFRAVLFPWAFLFLMIPLPAIIMQQFTFPLQMFASKLATWCLQTSGIPAFRDGNIIVLPRITLEVAEACSGIRSLVSLLTLAIIYGYLMENRNRVRIILALSAVPIAVLANVFRIFATGVLVEYWDPDKAMGFFHEFQGWVIFVVSLILLFGVHRVINVIWKPTPAAPPQIPDASSTPGRASGADHSTWNWPARFALTALLLLATAIGLQAYSRDEIVPSRQNLSSLPQQLGTWTGTDDTLDEETLKVLGPGEFLLRDYEDPTQTAPWVNLFVAYYPTQKFGDTFHTPRHCIVGAGFTPVQREVVQLPGPHGPFPANRWVASKGLERNLVLYWFQAHGRVVTSEYSAKYYLIADSIRLHRSDGALVRFLTPMYPNETPDAAQARVMQLGSQVLPYLDQSIPR
jgi:exosortase D (VPLPA-CTERM-specific)